jgi:hypothetical protein
MSHRVTTQTEIRDKALAVQALQEADMSFSEASESTLRINSGPIAGAVINLTTGEVTGDTDRHNRGNDSLGLLKRFYAEAKIKQECRIQGITIEKRIVEKDGRIRLSCQGHFA